MAEPMPIRELISPLEVFEKHVNTLPDGARSRFIGCAFAAVALAIRLDKPKYDLRGLFETQMGMMKSCLDDWAEQDDL